MVSEGQSSCWLGIANTGSFILYIVMAAGFQGWPASPTARQGSRRDQQPQAPAVTTGVQHLHALSSTYLVILSFWTASRILLNWLDLGKKPTTANKSLCPATTTFLDFSRPIDEAVKSEGCISSYASSHTALSVQFKRHNGRHSRQGPAQASSKGQERRRCPHLQY